MKYFIFIASLLLLSSANPSQTHRIAMYKESPELRPSYLSVDTYQEEYIELQKKSLNIDIKVKNILETVKSH